MNTVKKGTIIYRSKYGAAEKYARWLAESTGFGAVPSKAASPEDIRSCETIVFCGGVYAGGIAGLSFLRKNANILKDRRAAVFCAGASPHDEGTIQALRARNLKDALDGLPLFYGRGALDVSRLTFRDGMLCRLMQKALAKQDPAGYEPWMTALMDAAGHSRDWTDRDYLKPLLTWLNL